jgi:HSP20 family molecular chaperone IbpA
MSKDKIIKNTNKVQNKLEKDIEMTQDKPTYTPNVDIYEDDSAICVYADMPGVNEKNISISLDDDVLKIVGEQDDVYPTGMKLIYKGYTPGILKRAFTLGVAVNQEKIKALIKNGVLAITLPKAEQAKPRKISVTAG